jgi:hypothetical protein
VKKTPKNAIINLMNKLLLFIKKIKTKMITHRQIILVWVMACLTGLAMILQLYMSLTEMFYNEYQRYAKVEVFHVQVAHAQEAEQPSEQPKEKTDMQKVAIIKQYLDSKNSPMASASKTLVKLENWKLIIAISNAESTFCRQIPRSSKGVPNYNCWGIGGASNMHQLGSDINVAVIKMNKFLNDNPRGKSYSHMTLDEMNGIYCQDAKRPGRECKNWEENIQKVINELNALGL